MTVTPAVRWTVLGALLLAAGWLALFGDKTPPGQVAAAAGAGTGPQPMGPATRPAASSEGGQHPARSPARRAASASAPLRALAALVPREVLVPAAPRRTAVDLFAPASWALPVAPPVNIAAAEGPPTAPPLPFTVLGKKLEAGRWEVYLAKGDQTVIARQGDVIDGGYRVEKIEPPVLSLVYLPLGELQTMDMGDFE